MGHVHDLSEGLGQPVQVLAHRNHQQALSLPPAAASHLSSFTPTCCRIREGDRQLEDAFVAESTAAGLLQLFGHPLMGGLRVCIYNGLPDEAIDALLHFMAAFRLKYQGR